jgi:hypothetical protein
MTRMSLVRIWLPVAIVVAGIVLIIAAPDRIEGGILVVSAGLSVWLLNWLWRVGVSGERDRDAEDRAREYFDKHGRWPDEKPPARRS